MGFLSLDWTLIVQLINFAIFFVLLNAIFLRPVGKAVAARRAYINKLSEDYAQYQGQANDLRAQAAAIRTAARREGQLELARARAEASNQAAAAASKFTAQAQGIVEEAQRTVASELAAARENEPKIVGDLAQLMVERALPEAAS